MFNNNKNIFSDFHKFTILIFNQNQDLSTTNSISPIKANANKTGAQHIPTSNLETTISSLNKIYVIKKL